MREWIRPDYAQNMALYGLTLGSIPLSDPLPSETSSPPPSPLDPPWPNRGPTHHIVDTLPVQPPTMETNDKRDIHSDKAFGELKLPVCTTPEDRQKFLTLSWNTKTSSEVCQLRMFLHYDPVSTTVYHLPIQMHHPHSFLHTVVQSSNLMNVRNNWPISWQEALSSLRNHPLEHPFFLSTKREELYGFVLIIGNSIRSLPRTDMLFLGQKNS
jgi:hypothetical protein